MDTTPLRIQIWQESVNANGGLLGRPVELVGLDDQTNPKLVADIYQRQLETVVGKVTFGDGGGWAQPRVLTVQLIYPYAKARR